MSVRQLIWICFTFGLKFMNSHRPHNCNNACGNVVSQTIEMYRTEVKSRPIESNQINLDWNKKKTGPRVTHDTLKWKTGKEILKKNLYSIDKWICVWTNDHG